MNPFSRVDWLRVNWWTREPWRKPDKFEKIDEDGEYQAVWYSAPHVGKYGTHGDDVRREDSQAATEVVLTRETFTVTEYMHVSEWFMDEPWDPEEHGDFWRIQTVEFDPEDVRKILLRAVKENPKLKMPKDPKTTARWVAGLGVAYIGYYGGEEGEVEELP